MFRNARVRRALKAGGLCLLLAGGAGLALDRVFPPDLSRLSESSVMVLDADGGLLRAFTTSGGLWRLPARPDQVDPLYLAMLLAYVSDYRFARVTAFLNPYADELGDGYQVLQGLGALGTGGTFGVGLGASRTRWGWVPNAHTDFIFAIIGEEIGFAGGVVIIALFALIAVLGLVVAFRAPDRFGRFLAVGITVWITSQAVVNIGGVVQAMPITGMPLPFISFGGTALVMAMGAAGVLLSIARRGVSTSRRRTR